MPHDTITPQQQFAHEGLLHIQSINKPAMIPRQAVEACRQFSDNHTFIANHQCGLHVSSFDGSTSFMNSYTISIFNGVVLVEQFGNLLGFEKLVESVERYFFPFRKREDNDEDRFNQ